MLKSGAGAHAGTEAAQRQLEEIVHRGERRGQIVMPAVRAFRGEKSVIVAGSGIARRSRVRRVFPIGTQANPVPSALPHQCVAQFVAPSDARQRPNRLSKREARVLNRDPWPSETDARAGAVRRIAGTLRNVREKIRKTSIVDDSGRQRAHEPDQALVHVINETGPC